MVGFQSTDVGYFPNEWKIERMDSYFEIQQGKSVSKANRIGNNQKPFLRTSNLLWGKVILDELDYLHFSKEEEIKFKLNYDDLLVCEGGDIGRTAIWKNKMDGIYYQNHLHRLRRITSNITPEFILFWMNYAFVYGKLYFGRGNITTIPNLSKSRLSEFTIPVPPLPEQCKIAYILSTVQKAIEQQDKLIKTTTELKKALMQKLFTEGTKGEKQKQTEIGLVPESWEVVKIGDIGSDFFGGGTPSTRVNDYWKGEIHWTTSKRLDPEKIFLEDGERRISKSAVDESSTNVVPKNNLVISTRVTVGKVAINLIDIAISQDLTGIIIDDKKYCREFLAYQILTERVQRIFDSQKRGATIKGITREDLKDILLAIPKSKSEQKEVANILLLIDKEIDYHQEKKQTLSDLFKTLLHELMTGQRRVHELEFEEMGKLYNLTDEPLSMVAEK
jgi:type I restriction enzyme S subunit